MQKQLYCFKRLHNESMSNVSEAEEKDIPSCLMNRSVA